MKKPKASALDRTPAFDQALALMEQGGPFTFITGRAGTGKSTLLRHFRLTTSLIVPVLAPTGVAALNVEGETIHRFFRFAPSVSVQDARLHAASLSDPSVYRKADALIIDEISMVRADLMDCMDQFLRVARKDRRPFGGLRIIAIGDLYQLPPVLTSSEREAFSQLYSSPFFFASHVMQELLEAGDVAFLELEKVYRQPDRAFVSLLNAVRNRSVTLEQLEKLNKRVDISPPEEVIVLTTINASADQLNESRIQRLPGEAKIFEGAFIGNFPKQEAPAEKDLQLKIGARVMCVANDTEGKFVNGSLGWVRGFGGKESTGQYVEVDLDTGGRVLVGAHTWSIYRSVYNKATHSLDQERLGSFMQIPLRLAWAVTIHKSQGKTFDQAVVDLGDGAFTSGQTYVALSRCRSLEGLSLMKPIRMQDIRIEYAIVNFMKMLKYTLTDGEVEEFTISV